MMTIFLRSNTLVVLLVALVGCFQAPSHAGNPHYERLKNFIDLGSNPTALIEGKDGLLYGTFQDGGRKWEGAVFKLKKDGSGYAVLHHFTSYPHRDGSWPQGLIEGTDGVLYGATQTGGNPADPMYPTGCGTVFKLNTDGSGYSVLHRFGSTKGDGVAPWAAVIEGPDGALYGTTLEGGRHEAGTIFKLKKAGTAYEILHHFAGGDTDGASPMVGLLLARDGLLYGTTDSGGKSGGRNGTVFRIHPDGSGFKVLHNFPSKGGDGRMPRSPLVEGSDGTLFGTTKSGGENDAGTVFKLNKDGSGYRILHSFSGSLGLKPDPKGMIRGVQNGVPTKFSDAGDGSGPAALVLGSDGALYGVTEFHGKAGGGTAFKLTPDGKSFAPLHNFPAEVVDGKNPSGAMLRGSDGAIYGMTKTSEGDSFATLFRIKFQ